MDVELTPDFKVVLDGAIKQSVAEGYSEGLKQGRARALFTMRLQLAVILIQCLMMIWFIHDGNSRFLRHVKESSELIEADRKLKSEAAQLEAQEHTLESMDAAVHKEVEEAMRVCGQGR